MALEIVGDRLPPSELLNDVVGLRLKNLLEKDEPALEPEVRRDRADLAATWGASTWERVMWRSGQLISLSPKSQRATSGEWQRTGS